LKEGDQLLLSGGAIKGSNWGQISYKQFGVVVCLPSGLNHVRIWVEARQRLFA